MMKKYKILCLAGGGVRAVVTCKWIETLKKEGFLNTDEVDLYSGTSAGSMVVAGLIKPDPYPIEDMKDIANDIMKHAFKRSKWIPANLSLLCTGSKYHTKNLEEAAKSVFGGDSVLFGDCKPAVINVYDRYRKYRGVRRAMGHALTNIDQLSEKDTRFKEMPLYKIITASCVAPMAFDKYMPDITYKSKTGETKTRTFNFTDGGQADNLGMISAVRVARRAYCSTKKIRDDFDESGSVPFRNMRVLGIGNGGVWNFQKPLEYKKGIVSSVYRRFRATAKMTVGTIVQESEVRSLETTRDIFGKYVNHVKYINYQLPKEIALDDLSAVGELERFAEEKSKRIEVDQDIRAWFKGYWNG